VKSLLLARIRVQATWKQTWRLLASWWTLVLTWRRPCPQRKGIGFAFRFLFYDETSKMQCQLVNKQSQQPFSNSTKNKQMMWSDRTTNIETRFRKLFAVPRLGWIILKPERLFFSLHITEHIVGKAISYEFVSMFFSAREFAALLSTACSDTHCRFLLRVNTIWLNSGPVCKDTVHVVLRDATLSIYQRF